MSADDATAEHSDHASAGCAPGMPSLDRIWSGLLRGPGKGTRDLNCFGWGMVVRMGIPWALEMSGSTGGLRAHSCPFH